MERNLSIRPLGGGEELLAEWTLKSYIKWAVIIIIDDGLEDIGLTTSSSATCHSAQIAQSPNRPEPAQYTPRVSLLHSLEKVTAQGCSIVLRF